ncbi:EamA family transporter [Pedobacter insulae]|uniref:EamA-like transporter family protein n=1 Tax=Pedobacter insulae TaxID=414048 RepID=A0A1I3AMA0_9SPHI|nr:EamA family transporter [Pedobacter insulae]SFH50491.1 EamA-like transporter family protein [Pedobacter insulae]
MIYLVLSIICSVTVGVLLKLAKRYQISIVQAITWNYLFAICLSALFFRPAMQDLTIKTISPIHITLGLLLPSIFLFLALSVQKTGLARTDIAQRLSLFISLSAAYFIFKEEYTLLKYWGIAIGFLAIIFTLYRKSDVQVNYTNWLYPLLVFIGFGIIDVCFKLISQQNPVPYTTSLFMVFCMAFVISLIYIIYLAITKKTPLQLVNFVCGCVLGLFNFGNILFYMKAHRAMSNEPSTVFAAMNLGVIISGSIVGIFLFKEKLSKLNYLGLALALLAIILITLAQLNVVR